jgi:hypothetical protein
MTQAPSIVKADPGWFVAHYDPGPAEFAYDPVVAFAVSWQLEIDKHGEPFDQFAVTPLTLHGAMPSHRYCCLKRPDGQFEQVWDYTFETEQKALEHFAKMHAADEAVKKAGVKAV